MSSMEESLDNEMARIGWAVLDGITILSFGGRSGATDGALDRKVVGLQDGKFNGLLYRIALDCFMGKWLDCEVLNLEGYWMG